MGQAGLPTDVLSLTSFSQYQLAGRDDAEYDFRDFRWAKLERLRRGGWSSANISRDEALLEDGLGDDIDARSAMPSPKLDAMDVNRSLPEIVEATPIMIATEPSGAATEPMDVQGNSLPSAQSPTMWSFPDLDNAEPVLPMDWPWLLAEPSPFGYLARDSTLF